MWQVYNKSDSYFLAIFTGKVYPQAYGQEKWHLVNW